MNTKVIIKTDKFSFCNISEGSIGVIVHKARNYYNETVYDVRVDQCVLRLTKDEIEKMENN